MNACKIRKLSQVAANLIACTQLPVGWESKQGTSREERSIDDRGPSPLDTSPTMDRFSMAHMTRSVPLFHQI